jgi:hypothetical protein
MKNVAKFAARGEISGFSLPRVAAVEVVAIVSGRGVVI